jgi:hypothetical protein
VSARSDPRRWPWRKWLLAGASMTSAVTTVGGPVAVGGCTSDSCAAADGCPDGVCFQCGVDVLVDDREVHDVRSERASDVFTIEGGSDAGDDASNDGSVDGKVDAGDAAADVAGTLEAGSDP